MARLYTNENFPMPAVEVLRQLGHDALTTQDAGQADRAIPDDEVLHFASSERRILVTLNRRHFVALHLAGHPHAGIIVCTFDIDFASLAQRIHILLLGEQDWDRRLERVNRP